MTSTSIDMYTIQAKRCNNSCSSQNSCVTCACCKSDCCLPPPCPPCPPCPQENCTQVLTDYHSLIKASNIAYSNGECLIKNRLPQDIGVAIADLTAALDFYTNGAALYNRATNLLLNSNCTFSCNMNLQTCTSLLNQSLDYYSKENQDLTDALSLLNSASQKIASSIYNNNIGNSYYSQYIQCVHPTNNSNNNCSTCNNTSSNTCSGSCC